MIVVDLTDCAGTYSGQQISFSGAGTLAAPLGFLVGSGTITGTQIFCTGPGTFEVGNLVADLPDLCPSLSRSRLPCFQSNKISVNLAIACRQSVQEHECEG